MSSYWNFLFSPSLVNSLIISSFMNLRGLPTIIGVGSAVLVAVTDGVDVTVLVLVGVLVMAGEQVGDIVGVSVGVCVGIRVGVSV